MSEKTLAGKVALVAGACIVWLRSRKTAAAAPAKEPELVA